jgi:hypothetical protein
VEDIPIIGVKNIVPIVVLEEQQSFVNLAGEIEIVHSMGKNLFIEMKRKKLKHNILHLLF